MKYYEMKRIAGKYRRNQTPAEKLLWSYIRKGQLAGRKFLRQHPLIYESRGNEHFFYIPDFYCAAEKLVIEVDGSVHCDQVERDKHRDEILKSRGIRILRIQNQILTEIEVVLAKIKAQFAGNPPSLPEGRGLGGG